MPNYRNELVTLDCELAHETEKAWIVVVDGAEIAVPKSLGEWRPDETDAVDGEITVPTWFAEREGLA